MSINPKKSFVRQTIDNLVSGGTRQMYRAPDGAARMNPSHDVKISRAKGPRTVSNRELVDLTGSLAAPIALSVEQFEYLCDNTKTATPMKVMFTPELATAADRRNTRNRDKSGDTEDAYTRDIDAGVWEENGESVVMSRTGKMLDGQHRTGAVLRTGKAIVTNVTFGVSDRAQRTIGGGKPRGLADDWKMRGVKYVYERAAWVRGLYLAHHGHSKRLARVDEDRIQAKYGASMEWLAANMPASTRLKRSPIMTAFVLGYTVEPAKTERALKQYCSGANIHETHPMTALRRFATDRASKVREGQRVQTLKALRCLAATFDGQELHKIVVNELVLPRFVKTSEKK